MTTNPSLNELKGLENVSIIQGSLKVNFNTSLTSLSGLDNISSILNSLSIRSNSSLLSLYGLKKLDSIKGSLGIIDNGMIQNLNGLNNLMFIGKSLAINSNKSLTSLDGLENLTYVGGRYDINSNILLSDYTELKGLLSGIELHALKAKAKTENKERKLAKAYKNSEVWITGIDKSNRYEGYIREIKDSSMVFSNYLDKSQSNYTTKKIDIKNIQSITYKSPNRSIGKGMLAGALTGLMVGGGSRACFRI